jgi:hypothetical protein
MALPTQRRPLSASRPPDYTQRSVKLRLFIALAALMAVLSIGERFLRNRADFAASLATRSNSQHAATDTTNLDRIAAGHRTAHDPPGTFIAVINQPEQPSVTALATVQDDTPIFRPAEREAWFHELARVRDTDDGQLSKQAVRNVAYLQLQKQPADFRGQIVSFRGTVRSAYRVPAADNDLNVKEYCVYVVQPGDRPDSVMWVYALDAPPGFPPLGKDSGDRKAKMRQDVDVTGVFFKRCVYAAEGGTFTAPVLIAKAPHRLPPPPAPAAAKINLLELAAAAAAALLLAVCIAAVVWKRTSHSGRIKRHTDSFIDLGPLQVGPTAEESIRQLEQQARGEEAKG